ncbi:CCR4-Not complex component, Not1-domain-containing protein [Macrophomina phaseolina]|uniref:CCR4-Not complex component, Not1-domain-containing protein n=1 Tax=Macrophomina phaseolina TaxID=35725 RepID=A0ABQ8G0Y6_9PEZI|nr:CCR4-Not complex component, Not1-domain-containing protein [Macrophomina phaseolina]
MSQQFPWGSSSQQPSGRRGLTPISTAFTSTRSNSAANSPSRSSFSPVNNPPSVASSGTRRIISRTSSASSTSSPFSPSHSGSQQQHSQGQLLSSGRSRTIASQAASHFASSAAALPSASQGGGGAPSTSGGGSSKVARASPSLSQSGNIGSPSSTTTASAPSGQSLAKIVIAQVFLLLSSLKEDKDKTKWEQQTDQIRKLVDSNGMEVFSKYFRRLLQSNAPQIFPGSAKSGDNSGSYGLLVEEMHKITRDPQQAYKIAESIDTTEGDLFRDFDLSTFMEHFKLDPVAKTTLALACKTTSKTDLRTKADAILSNNYQNFLMTLVNSLPDSQDDISPAILATVIDRLAQDPPRTWNDDSKNNLLFAIRAKYDKSTGILPPEVTAALHMFELLENQNPLIKHIQRAGPRATSSLDACKEMLATVETRDISYQQVANALLFMAITQNGQAYSASNFVAALREHRAGQRLDWQDVIHSFDREGLKVTPQQFLALYNAFLPLAQEYENFDIQLLWGGSWNHQETQLSFVVAFLGCSQEDLDVTQVPRLRKAFTLEQFEDASEVVKERAKEVVKHPLVSLDATAALFNIIFRSQETYNIAQRSQIPQTVINQNTDLFVVAASAVPKPWIGLQEMAMRQLFGPFVEKRVPNVYSFALHGLWKQDSIWVAARFLDFYNANPLSLTTIMEHAAEHSWIQDLVALNSDMSLDLAALAHREGLFDLEPWAQETLRQIPVFPRVLASFLNNKAETDLQAQREGAPAANVPLAVKTVHPLLGFLQGHLPDEELVSLQRICIGAYPRLINYGEGFDEIIDANSKDGNAISPEADRKMQEHYRNMYSGESDVRHIIEELQKYKTSEDPADQDLFACMIHGLFDEYNCFGEYPLEALATTAVLFGGIIQYNLLSRIPLQAGLAMVLEAVQDYPPEASMYKFGLQALLNFSNRLHEWPSFCDRLLRVPGLQGTEVWNKAEDIVRQQRSGETNGETNGDSQNGVSLTNGNVEEFGHETSARQFTCLHADPPLRPEVYEDPDEEVQDKVLFVLNNVSERNIVDKLKDLKEALEEKHHQWFASYLVEERAKMQPNFQQLYLDMLALFDDKMLWAEVLRETYVSVIRMLNAESTMNSSTERTHLKNLGGWLGSLTIARDKPIKFKNISFKDLLIEGHDTQRLLIVIPFTCKVLIQASKSTVFRPPNPWLMEIIRLLMELYHFAELKLNLKFEIEVLCKGLDLDHKIIEPSDCIRSRPLHEEEILAQAIPDGLEGFNDLSLVGLNRSRAVNDRFSPAAIQASLPDLASSLVYPPASGNMATTSRLRQIFHTAAQSAIAEIIAPVVERSVTIAAISTSQLVAKDFATEADENKMREAAHTMVKSLSGSLALVTCKEPLRMSIMNNIRILARDLPEQALPEGLILMFVNDNLDTVCGMVEQAAEQQSIPEIDLQIEGGIRARRYHRNTNPREPFNDPPVKHWATFIPEPYRQSPGGLNPEQLAIYEDFGRQARGMSQVNNASQDSGRQMSEVLQEQYPQVPNLPTPAEPPAIPRPGSQAPSRLQAAPPISASMPQAQLNGYVDAQTASERALAHLLELQRTSKEAQEEHIEELGPSAPTRDAFEQLIHLVENSGPPRDQLCLGIAGRVITYLFAEAERRLEIEVMVQLVIQLCQMSVNTSRQIMMWLANVENERLLNAPVVICMVTAGLLDLQRIDMAASKAIQARNLHALDFLSQFMDEILLGTSPAAFRTDFSRSLEALTQWLAEDSDLEVGKLIMSKLQVPQDRVPTPPDAASRYQVEYVFEEWVHLLRFGQRQAPSERMIAAFINQLHARGFMKTQNDSAHFLRVCVEASVDAYEREELVPFPSLDNAYIFVDALAKLIVSLVIYQGEGEDTASNKPKYLEGILSLIILVLSHHQRTRHERLNQKVFFRLFNSIICELHDERDLLPGLEPDFMLVIGKAFLVLQPKHFPAFTFSWLTLVSHRMFMPVMLKLADDTRWDLYAKLTEVVLSHAGNLMKPVEPSSEARNFYRGVLRVLLVIHHDFPEFLAENHFRLCNAIPMHCTQLRNLVVSAYPSSYPELPDPFTAGFKVDRLEDVRKAPSVRGDIEEPLSQRGLKDVVDNLLRSAEQSPEEIQKLCDEIYRPQGEETGLAFAPVLVDTALLHSITLYIGSNAVSTAGKGPVFNAASPHAKLLESLAKELRPEGRYHFLSAMTNQLRWPNSHTHWFSYAILHLFGSSTDQISLDVKQQITRVLLERLLVHRPHPWGLIITLLEILKNRDYQFWELPFVKAAPEVERLFGALFQHINQSPRAIS